MSYLQLTFLSCPGGCNAGSIRGKRSLLLINQPMTIAGFYDDGSSPGSIINVITSEIKSARSMTLEQQSMGTLSRKNYKQ
eukprot:scaffold10316_cov71-Cyclotella_meneghiniana.AAC.9